MYAARVSTDLGTCATGIASGAATPTNYFCSLARSLTYFHWERSCSGCFCVDLTRPCPRLCRTSPLVLFRSGLDNTVTRAPSFAYRAQTAGACLSLLDHSLLFSPVPVIERATVSPIYAAASASRASRTLPHARPEQLGASWSLLTTGKRSKGTLR